MTPFSGLSLIVHVGIIGFGSLFNRGNKRTKLHRNTKSKLPPKIKAFFNGLLSLIIILAIGGFMSYLFYYAIVNGLEDGENEWQRQLVEGFVSTSWTKLVNGGNSVGN
jgi:hypothetical protein